MPEEAALIGYSLYA